MFANRSDLPVVCHPYHHVSSRNFTQLFIAEQSSMVTDSYLNDEDKQALRIAAVEIIESTYMKDSQSGTFDALIPYTAMTYFDRFLSQRDNHVIPHVIKRTRGNDTHLFVICCLTLALKLRNKSFVLEVFLGERKLVYSKRDVLRMELEICRGLQWRMRTVTPFRFVEFIIPLLRLEPDLQPPRSLIRQLIVKSQFDIASTHFRPSVMAAAAVITVTEKMHPTTSIYELVSLMNVGHLKHFLDVIFTCHELLEPLYAKLSPPSEPKTAPGETSGGSIKMSPPQPKGDEQMKHAGKRLSTDDDDDDDDDDDEDDSVMPESSSKEDTIQDPGKELAIRENVHDEEKEDDSVEPLERKRTNRKIQEASSKEGTIHDPGKELATSEDVDEEKEASSEERTMRRPGKEPATGEIQEASSEERTMRRPGKEPATGEIQEASSEEEITRRPGKELATSGDDDGDFTADMERTFRSLIKTAGKQPIKEEQQSSWTRRPGKEPATYETDQAYDEERSFLLPFEDETDDGAMDFELGWIALLEESGKRTTMKNAEPGCGTVVVQKITDFYVGIGNKCDIM